MNEDEIWKPVVGFEGYEVSTLGRVRSFRNRHGRRAEPRLLKPGAMSKGYLLVVLRDGENSHSRCVHRLVLEAFIGPRPPGVEARHVNDRDPNNNCLSNLVWGTSKQNEDDKIRHGTSQHGERNHRAKLTNLQAQEIRVSQERGDDLARQYNVAKSVISQIRTGKKYKEML